MKKKEKVKLLNEISREHFKGINVTEKKHKDKKKYNRKNKGWKNESN